MRLVTHSPTTTEENENSMEIDDNFVYIGNNLVKTDTREREKKRGPNDESVNIDHFERERIEKNQYQSIGPCSSNEHHLSLGKNECPSKLFFFFFFFLSLVFSSGNFYSPDFFPLRCIPPKVIYHMILVNVCSASSSSTFFFFFSCVLISTIGHRYLHTNFSSLFFRRPEFWNATLLNDYNFLMSEELISHCKVSPMQKHYIELSLRIL